MEPTSHPPIPAHPLISWREMGDRFGESRDCLACFLALEAAEIIAAAKPANLVNLVNRAQSCGQNIYRLWNRWGKEILEESGLSAIPLRRDASSMLLMLFDEQGLKALLEDPRVGRMLRRAGHQECLLEPIVDTFRKRIAEGRFPHEIGILLGYPLKDVAGFLGWIDTPPTCQGPWKIYGDPAASLRLAELHRGCRSRMANLIAGSDDPLACVRRVRSFGRTLAAAH